ncbi:DUF72 domain-containing protein [Candidatus Bathyarchaeota archaeon]|nr:DUF72 domain-containing protein [Candidatus Bathyarchaeota archaeon]NIU80954.1 DUF72 domain-containing protein [Candidatus Bathyarchaeota archaeon]
MKSKRYLLGCSGWYYDHWVDRFYPEDIDKAKWLEYYAEHFNSVEVNSTFYHFPTKRMLKAWYRKTQKNFVFTLKANQLITHKKKFQGTQRLVDRFYQLAELLEEKLGCILFQIPPFLSKDIVFLEAVIEQLDSERDNVVEFRHRSWFCDEVYSLLRENRVGFCTVSAPDLPPDLEATSHNAYIRFHGRKNWYRYLYSKEELQEWAERIRSLEVENVFCYFNNDYQANAVKNCQQLKKNLE